MIREYKYEYNGGEASVHFKVDTDKIEHDLVKELYNFFSWSNLDEPDGDLLDRLMYQYCRRAIAFATANNHNTSGVIRDFEEAEGVPKVDGSHGYTLIHVNGIDLTEIELEKPWL